MLLIVGATALCGAACSHSQPRSRPQVIASPIARSPEIAAVIDSVQLLCDSSGVRAAATTSTFADAQLNRARPTHAIGFTSRGSAIARSVEAAIKIRDWLYTSGWRDHYESGYNADGPCGGLNGLQRANLRCIVFEDYGPCDGVDELPSDDDTVPPTEDWHSFGLDFFSVDP